MKDSFKFDYFYGSQAEQFSFFRLPKILIRDEQFKKISSDAKILYGIMLDRMSLSRENKWMDQNNRVYIIFTLKEVMKEFECCQRKAGSLMAELDSKSGIGLIERKRQGLGRPDLIYLKNFIAVQEDISQKEEKQEQGEVLPLQSGKEMPLITGAEDSFQTGKAIEKKTIISGSSGHLEEEKALVADPVVKNGRTLLGIRDLANGLNADVQWDGARKEVKLTTKPVEQYPNYDKLLKYIEEYRKAVGEQTDKQKEQQEQQKQEKVDVTNESSYAEQMLRLVNEEREKVGVSPLELDSTLTAAAQIRAKEIIEVFDHTRPNGKACKTVLEELGYEGDYAGENISKGTFEEPESAMELWMDSKGHRENILNPDYKYLGVGSDFESESNGLFDDIVSYWVQIFAR